MTTDEIGIVNVDEETPLLQQRKERTRTPLPKLQIGIVLLLQMCEPICSQSIYPYINELVSGLEIIGGDIRKVGYYAGLIESLFFATEAITVLQWSRTSDVIGRKPVILIGMIGTMISMLLFGLSRTFWTLVVSRCLTGLLNGNIGVLKSAMGELTDSSNRADAFALMPVAWGVGASVGPLIGGSFARPSDQFPTLFTDQFWKDYPYFLPCLVSALFVAICVIITIFWFKECNPVKSQNEKRLGSSASSESSSVASTASQEGEVLPLRKLLTFPVVISILNYVVLAFLNISVSALLPLFFHMPIEMGGLDLDPAYIGYVIGIYGAGTGLFQVLFFAPIVRRLGVRRAFVWSVSTFAPVFMTFPVTSLAAKQYGVSWQVWILVGFLVFLLFFMDTAYGCVFMYVTASAPNKRSLGATNGLSQTTVSLARAIGPALSTSLFSFSIENNILYGYGVYAVLALLSLGALLLAIQLPERLWGEDDHDHEN
ncbi:major facilitator superfamily transporter [Coprinopsis cinerea okayama7|uniref:Major facilitator superfamily transporter n=1 Tax=Coprinopsis cinerea (strain Okayama-7 / 130 / ATCC MYA-4618 / FGSC 9003) TaxID=240176 RepID=A8NUY3_COPC7|nr:major facilitator superfamily transporter [Coprinopsis cinerea okayama7\|eukprot:XP_001836562.2 major facilitator superfamily transporter [Coprinopsis cinerea okayama7\